MCYTSALMREPKKFVGLHSHSTFSTFDAIGTPQDHVEFAIKNGADALALTDHGNMNGFSHQYVHAEKLKKKGVNFKAIHGIEAYFVPSLESWKNSYEANKQAAAIERDRAKREKAKPRGNNEDAEILRIEGGVGNDMFSTETDLADAAIENLAFNVDDEEGGTVMEDEEASKSNKIKDPIKRAPAHLVLLAKNTDGLKQLFSLVSDSASVGSFNGYPRVDLHMLEKYSKGNIIALSACVAGWPSKIIFNHQKEPDWNLWLPNEDNFEIIQAELAEYIQAFQASLGKENYYLELQFNRLGAQHLVNQHLIEASKRTGAPLVVTCDAHYSDPSHWREREIYKLLNPKFMKSQDDNAKKIPQRIDELKCELYPKNAEQVWTSYKSYTEDYSFYDDDIIREAIERTHDIAHQQIGDCQPSRSVKLPAINKIVDDTKLQVLRGQLGEDATEDAIAFREVKNLAIEGLRHRKLLSSQTHIDRLKYELEVIYALKFAKYFLTYYHIMKICGEHMLLGNARGSAGGSLLAYVLNITQMDPIKHELLFERFMTRTKKSFPDIDSDFSDREKAVHLLQDYFGEENVIPVSNFAALKPLSLIKDLSKLYKVPFEIVNRYTKGMIPEVMAVMKGEPGFDAAQFELTFQDLAEHSPSFQEFMKTVTSEFDGFKTTLDVLWKQQRTVGRHAGGVIITTNAKESMPLIKAKGGLQTPWPEGLAARHLEDFGLLKFDVLGLGTLRIFEETIRRILKKEGSLYPVQADINKWFFDNLHPDNNEMDDPTVYKNVYWDSKYAGIFQFVKANVQKFMQQMRPKSILDIAIATSIFRPGPMGLGAHNIFLNNRQHPEKVYYAHPVLEQILGPTSGLLIFQEQLQLIVNKLSGMHLDDTDSIRKAFTKKDKSNAEKQAKEIKALGEKFVEDSVKHSGITENQAETVWEDFKKWTAYGFNRTLIQTTLIPTYTQDGCFVATKQIKDIGEGEWLRSRDEATKKDIFVRVIARHDHGFLPLFKFRFNRQEVTCTFDHKFRVLDGRMLPIWVILQERLSIIGSDYCTDTGVSNFERVKPNQTYDLEVDHVDHQFYLENGLLTSNSHAMAYAITSYQCAWLLTYYPDEWIASYLDFATVGKGKTASGEDPKSVAITEATSLGYKLMKPDINISEETFVVHDKCLIPSFSAIKGVGVAALREIEQHRPYSDIKDLVINPDGKWRHSKFNKRAFQSLIKTGAFASMDLVGPGKTFANYKQMHTVFIDNHDLLKRIASRKKNNDVVAELNRLIELVTTQQPEDWTLEEKVEFSRELTGQVDISLIISPKILKLFANLNLTSVDTMEDDSILYWAIVDSCVVDKTSTGKEFLRLSFHGESGVKRNCKVWNYNSHKDPVYKANDIIVGKFEIDDWGIKTMSKNIKVLAEKKEKA